MPKHTIRTEKRHKFKEVVLTRKTAIFAFCRECMGFQVAEIEKCTDPHCPLFLFRTNAVSKEHSTRQANPKAIAALKEHRVKKNDKTKS